MKANYHTHTARCGHAEGTDESYLLAAIGQGFETLGFSDHMPWPYESGFTNSRVRMPLVQMGEYIDSIRSLKAKYAGKIDVLVGFECEYFPAYMGWLAEMREKLKLDYLIFGNHYERTDEGGFYFGSARTSDMLRRYVDSAEKGARTGLFAYMAHPDLFMRRYPAFDADCAAAAKDLCAICVQYDLPMEYNLHDRYRLGEQHGEGYPHPKFFEIANAMGAKVIIGLDAHEPEEIADPREWEKAKKEVAVFGDRWVRGLTLG